MKDIEKVIRGLKQFITDFKPFCGNEADWQKIYDALALLKAQEPHVMTFDEIVAAAPGTVVWLEDYDKTDVIAGLVKKVYIYTKVIDFLIVNEKVNDEVTADLDTYSEGWRCWTSRPDQATREVTSWNE